MKKIDQFILYLFYVYVFLLPFDNMVESIWGIHTIYRPVRILSLLIGILILISRKFTSIRFHANDLKLLGVYLFGLIPSLIAYLENRLNTEYFWSTSLQYFIILWIFLLIKNIPFEYSKIYKCLAIFCFAVVLNSLIMIYQFLYLDIGRQSGLMDNPNFAAFACDVALAFYLFHLIHTKKSILHISWIMNAMVCMVLIAALFVAGSRSAMIPMVIIILFLLYFRASWAQIARHTIAVVSIGMVLFVSLNGNSMLNMLPAWNRLITLEGKEDSRIVLWKQGFDAYRETNYLGMGIEQFKNPDNYKKYVKRSDNTRVINLDGLVVHNDFLTVLYEYGIIPLLLFISFYLTVWKKLRANAIYLNEAGIYYCLYFNMFWFSMFTSSFQLHSMWFVYVVLTLVAYLPLKENSKAIS